MEAFARLTQEDNIRKAKKKDTRTLCMNLRRKRSKDWEGEETILKPCGEKQQPCDMVNVVLRCFGIGLRWNRGSWPFGPLSLVFCILNLVGIYVGYWLKLFFMSFNLCRLVVAILPLD